MLRDENNFNKQEKEIIHNICQKIFSHQIHPRLKFALEISASLLQYSFLRENYQVDANSGIITYKYYKSFF